MAQYFTPGVYVEEFDNSPRAIEGIGTSVAGFVGFAEKGPTVGAPTLISSYRDFVRVFGGPLSEFEYGEYRYLAPAVEQFFVNGGTSCFVVRAELPGAKAAVAKKGVLTVEAKNSGKWGNRIQVSLNSVAKRKMQIVGANGDAYVAKTIEGFREGDLVVCNGEYNKIKSIFDNSITFEKKFKGDIVDTALIPTTLVYLVETDISVRYGEEVENYKGLSFNTANPNYIAYRMANSELVTVSVAAFDAVANPVATILGDKSENGVFTLEGGIDGAIAKVSAGTFIGEDNGPGKRTGLEAFVENTNVSMLLVPGVTIPEVIVAMVAQCESLKDRFAIIDMPKDDYKVKDLLQYREMIDSTYAAMYHPWIQVYDRSANQPGFIPPSGAVAGVYARTDATRGVHKAPANETVVATGLSVNYNKAEQDYLNPAGINLIRTIPGQGIRVWGARTASSNSNFKYVNVRRLFIFVEESIKANTNWVVFEPNDTALWDRVRMTISNFLEGLWRAGMLAGASPAEAFFVEIGPSTMSKDDISNGRLVCNIGIAPSKPAEFVVFRVTQFTADAAGAESEE